MRLRILSLVGVALVLTSCESDSSHAIPLAEASTSPEEFFPRALYTQPAGCSYPAGPEMVLDDFQQKWFSAHLAAAQERPLVDELATNHNTTSFRFIWLRTFDNPVVVRVTDSGSEQTLVAVRLSGAGGYEPGTVADRMERQLSRQEWSRVILMLDRTKLFEQRAAKCDQGLDGSEWIVESIGPNGYHFLRRWTPQDGDVREFGLLLLELTGWRFQQTY